MCWEDSSAAINEESQEIKSSYKNNNIKKNIWDQDIVDVFIDSF